MKPVMKIVLFFLVCLAPSFLFAQQERAIDSLEKVLKSSANDTNKVLLLNTIGVKYQNAAKHDEALDYANKALKLAEELKYQRGIADVYNDMANTFYLKGNYQKAIECHLLAIKIRKDQNHQKKLGKSYNNLGACYERIGDYKKAIECHFLSLKIKESLHDSIGILKAYNNVGNLNLSLKNYPKALEYYTLSLDMAKKINDEGQIAMTLDNIASVHDETGEYQKALEYELESQKMAFKLNDRYMIGVNYTNLAGIYDNLEKYDLSRDNYLKALKVWEVDGNEDGIASICINLGQYYYKIAKDYKTAASYLERSLNYTQHKSILGDTYISLSELYEAIGNYKEARRYSVLYIANQRELYSENLIQQTAEIQTKYETEKKEKENLELKRKNQVQELLIKTETQKRRTQLIIAFSIVIFLLLLGYFIYYRRKKKEEAVLAAELAKQEKIRFRAIIEAEEKERSRIAQDLHDGIGQMLAASKMHVSALQSMVGEKEKQFAKKAMDILNDAYTEVRHISHNMMPDALMRLGLIPAIRDLVGNINAAKVLTIDFSTNVETSLGKSMDITIYRIVQEVLNNMIKHAQADHIIMEIEKNGANLNISISDNGVGFDTNLINESKGIGWKSIYSRVSMLDGTIKLDSILKEGTIVYINLKLKEE
ncbi:hypothetical protein CNR22_10075 [Sphingobacteriaceae bacterium]|nr:hypothetical protein CNR22_10075 [Sphingobacteriaceae bacterium]